MTSAFIRRNVFWLAELFRSYQPIWSSRRSRTTSVSGMCGNHKMGLMRPQRMLSLCLALTIAAAARASVGPQLAAAAARQVGVTRVYDPSYVQLRYPGGDVPLERGVCADVIVRAFRRVGVDPQRELHEDMRA